MNALKRLAFGILSSALLATGFARAAEQIDPLTKSSPTMEAGTKRAAPSSLDPSAFYLNDR